MTTNEKHQTENNGHRHKVVGPKWPTSGGAARILMDDLLRDCHRLNGPVSITRLSRLPVYYRQESSTAGHRLTEQSYLKLGIPAPYRTRSAMNTEASSACFIINESALLVCTLTLSVCLSVPRPRLSWSHILTSSPGFPFRPASCLFSCPPFCFHSSNQYNYVLILHKF